VKLGFCTTQSIRQTTGWLAPAVILAVLPKCPLCVVAWVAAGTGFGLSLAAATYLRPLVIALCLLSIACVALRVYLKRREETAASAYFAKYSLKK